LPWLTTSWTSSLGAVRKDDSVPMASKRQLAAQIVTKLRKNGYEAYFVGGCVRDLVLKRRPSDYDIATSAIPEQIEAIFPKTIPVGKAFGVMIVRSGGHSFEVATFREDHGYQDGRRPNRVEFSIAREDVARRDFTVNGLFYDPVKDEVLDWVGGREDAQKKLIRTIGDPKRRFEEDKLRLIRAVRFAANLDFDIEQKTLKAIQSMASQIKTVSAERIRDELIKMMSGPNPEQAIRWMDQTGLLEVVLPEVAVLKGIEQPKEFHPEGDVFVISESLFNLINLFSMV
jgi:poly(A) polymerase